MLWIYSKLCKSIYNSKVTLFIVGHTEQVSSGNFLPSYSVKNCNWIERFSIHWTRFPLFSTFFHTVFKTFPTKFMIAAAINDWRKFFWSQFAETYRTIVLGFGSCAAGHIEIFCDFCEENSFNHFQKTRENAAFEINSGKSPNILKTLKVTLVRIRIGSDS